ncbi:MAG: twin-arginine translocase TatA/TatE family subunit [Gammaproteobacteria bacterium]|nr:twin-arginine translocase TatA/TatE family subunit [Gammaproteobacteria bacterium]MDH5799853.1 twin-arginine translocase TatA/TatE family subunit [Gammaproteobacteria bacterium]
MGISIWQLLIILLIVLVLFGAKRLRNIGGDLGAAVKGFRGALKDGDEENKANPDRISAEKDGHVIEGEVTSKEKDKV